MGGWLILTQPGLAPDKKHQASLGALTSTITWQRKPQAVADLVNCDVKQQIPMSRLLNNFYIMSNAVIMPIKTSGFD
jgi:hypothetical protein